MSSPLQKNFSLYRFWKSEVWWMRPDSVRGAYRDRHETRDGMRWTRWSRRTSEADADGEVAWSWPPDAEVKFASLRSSRATGARKPGSLGRARRKPLKPLRREGRDDLAKPVVPSPCFFHARGAAGVADTRPSLRNGFNGFLRALPREPGFLAPVARELRMLANLTSASGGQDHTTSPSASASLVRRDQCVHRIPSRVS